ncbi:MAG: pyruvate dehydrogenase (acetyl-transferring) E1 component subunit alpha, partial [Microbacteriaceae bacterium]
MAAKARGARSKPSGLSGEPTDVMRDYYQRMALVRSFELRASEMYARAKIGGYCHLNLGEEATVIGLTAGMNDGDYLFVSYRDHGYALMRGMDANHVMAELFGKETGVSGGRGGSMHMFDPETRMLGGYGIVGGQIPPATGVALALSQRSKPGEDADAVLCLLGDGTTNIGAFHESLNLAGVWKLPIVYVIINNRLGMGTTVEQASAEPELFKRGCSYRIPGERIDGDDPIAVRDATRAALRKARVDRQPVLLEATSYRLRGHSVVDPARYRSAEDTERLRREDPLPAFRNHLLASGVFDEETAARIDAGADKAVAAAVDFADASPAPDVATLFDHVYATPVPSVYRGLPGDPVT